MNLLNLLTYKVFLRRNTINNRKRTLISLKHVMEIMPSRLVMVITTRTIFQLTRFTQFRELSVVRYLVGHVLYAQTVLGLVVSKTYVYQIYSIQNVV